ncbi:hypothetical protein Glove_804g14 [Diversispora epigaea]|uniref:Uncharacterized protein n=1 Tax=Diversispora epigaea TaxID=1348612 RepID=A0A397FYR8_9GLOM|nr:hypothetical protein Glove_804g14 [Diversispora epigaea]
MRCRRTTSEIKQLDAEDITEVSLRGGRTADHSKNMKIETRQKCPHRLIRSLHGGIGADQSKICAYWPKPSFSTKHQSASVAMQPFTDVVYHP